MNISDLPDWLARRIVADGDCWIWTGSKIRGYGQTGIPGSGGRRDYVHRLTYTYLVGPIPDGLHIDHVYDRGCRQKACCNPDHLEPVTNLVNRLRWAATITSCVNGHEYTPANTYRDPKLGRRSCQTCKSLRKRGIDPAIHRVAS